jgi:hypothetical protein
MKVPRFLALIFGLVGVLSSTRAQSTWEIRSPLPTNQRLVSFATGKGLTVGVGGGGAILTTVDGATWTTRASGTFEPLSRVLFGSGKFIAFGSNSTLSSSDGIAWTPVAERFVDMAYDDGLFVAVVATSQSSAELRTSSDLVTWTSRRSVSYIPRQLCTSHGIFVAIGLDGAPITSTDGIHWTDVQLLPGSSQWGYLAAGDDRFLLCYGASNYLSTDGVHWEEVTQTVTVPGSTTTVRVPNLGTLSSIGYAGGYFYIRQSGYAQDRYAVYRSADGRNWSRLLDLSADFDFSTLGTGTGFFVVSEVVQLYTAPSASSYVLHTSTDGLEWTSRTTTPVPNRSIAWPVYGLGRYFLAGRSSPDGRTWAETGFEPTHAAGDRVFRIITSPEWNNPTTTVEVSADGDIGSEIDPKMSRPRSVACGAGRYVLVGDGGKISTSVDALAWTLTTSPTTRQLNTVTYVSNRFIAVGESGTVLTSTDGLTWTDESPAAFAGLSLENIAYGSDRVVVGTNDSGTPASATLSGGLTIVAAAAGHCTSIIFFNGSFLANFQSGSSSGGQGLFVSTTGLTWAGITMSTTAYSYPSRLATGNGTALFFSPNEIGSYPSLIYSVVYQTPESGPAVTPAIVANPISHSAPRGESVTFTVGATGTGPLTYQWSHNGTPIPGASASVLKLTLVDSVDAGNYTVTVTNAAGSATSSDASLAVTAPVALKIMQQPSDQEVGNSTPTLLSVAVTGSGPISYQWRKNGEPIGGATKPTLEVEAYPLSAGSYDVVVSAPYSTVTSRAALVTWGGFTATATPGGQVRVPVGASVSVRASATGAHPPFHYRWSLQDQINAPEIPSSDGLLTLTNVQGPRIDSYAAVVTDSVGHLAYVSFQLIVLADGSATMHLDSQPQAQPVTLGGTAQLWVAAPAGANYHYQWRRYGQPIPDATNPTLTIPNFGFANNGEYDVIVYNADYTAAIVSQTVNVAAGASRLVNLSALGFAGTGEETFFQGFVLEGNTQDLNHVGPIIRSVGPGLVRFGVENVLADPKLSVLGANHVELATNDNWSVVPTGSGLPASVSLMNSLGASPLEAGSLDSALVLPTPAGGLYFVQASGSGGTTGYVLNEIYAPDYPFLRLSNLSARSRVAERPLIAGFVISGDIPLKVLIRGVGPSLAKYGIVHPLGNPKLTLFHGSQEIHNNDRWADARNLTDLRAATNAVGAFALDEGSNDAAMLETLEPGVYTAHVTSVDGASGVALVEIYAVP